MYYVLTESYENGFSEEIEETTIVMISRDLKEIEAMKNRLIDIEEIRQYKHYQDCDLWECLRKNG